MTPRIEPFRVLPWDFFADDAATAPPHVEALQISGAPREFELLKRGARVYFRLRNDAARVWATLDDSDDEDFVRTFRRAIGSGRIGRVLERQRGESHCEYDFLQFSLLMSAHGEVQGSEWCLPNWFDLEADSPKISRYLKANPKIGIFHPKWAPPFGQTVKESWSRFAQQPFTETDRRLTQLRFFLGDPIILEQICRAYFLINGLGARNRSQWIYFHTRNESFRGRPTSTPAALYCSSSSSGIFPTSVQDLISSYFSIGGVSWECEIERDERRFWEVGSYKVDLSISKTVSAHDQLENHLTLRDWLTGKLAPARIEEILNSLRP